MIVCENLTKPFKMYDEVTRGILDSEIETIVKRKKMAIAFLKDRRRVILERRIYNF